MEFKDVEASHQKYKQKVQKQLWICGAITLLVGLILVVFTGASSLMTIIITLAGVGIFGAVIAAIVVALLSRKEASEYRRAYKAYFVEKNLAAVFTDMQYNHEAGLSKEILRGTGMVNTGDVYSSNDLTVAKYKDVAFSQADVHIQVENTDSDGDTTYVTIFKGRFMIFEFPKQFNFRIEVVERGFGANRVPGRDSQTGRKFERIKLESSEFNKIFKTYAEDGFEAFYLLDPTFINSILELNQVYKGKLLLGFLDNKLLVGLKDGKDAFEPPSALSKLDEAAEITKVRQEITLVTDFIDKLKLNQKIFR